MINSWKVKHSGKLDISIFSYIVILLAYTFFTLRVTKEEGDFMENFRMGLIFLFPFIIAALTIPSALLKKKKIPQAIAIDPDSGKIKIDFFKNHGSYEADLTELSYQKIESAFLTILVLYKKEIATRGHTLNVELFSMVALDISTSWNKRMLFEIINQLNDLNIEKHVPQKNKPIIDYIFE